MLSATLKVQKRLALQLATIKTALVRILECLHKENLFAGFLIQNTS